MDLLARARVHAALGDESRLRIVDELMLGDRTFQELALSADLPGNLAAHHLRLLESAGLIMRRVSEGDHRRRYISLCHEPLLQISTALPGAPHPAFVVFVCTHNSARSLFAAELWRTTTGRAADSAGTDPAPNVHPLAVAVAHELGVDLTGSRPKSLDDIVRTPDLVISVCDRAHESERQVPGPSLHWSIPDPVADGTIAAFRSAFSEISSRVNRLAAAHSGAARPQ